MNHGGKKAERGVTQGMLTQQRRLMHVHPQAKHESQTNTDAQWLVDVPEHQHQGHEVRHPGHTAQRQHVQQQRCYQAGPNEQRIGWQQQLLA